METVGQLRQLRDLECPLVQGFLLARPQAAAEVELFLFPARATYSELPAVAGVAP